MKKRERVFRTLWATTVSLYLVASANNHIPKELQGRAPTNSLVRFMMLRDARKREMVRLVSTRSKRAVTC